MLSIYLLLQKNTRQLEGLLLLGYSRAQLIRPYLALTLILNVLVLALALIGVMQLRAYYLGVAGRLLSSELGGTTTYTYLTALALLVITTLLNGLAIRRKIHSLPIFAPRTEKK